ncbi:dihydrofolate reductase [Patescibacteria group bacterium]|nr:MAG: dihydrofolate reductase [Patescibacteria group bacterium]
MKTILLMAVTADGLIGRDSKHTADWTSKADKKMFVEETKKAGVIIFGQATYATVGKPLPGRLIVVMTRKPDASKNIAGSVEYTDKQPKELLADLEQRGFSSVIIGGGATINGIFLTEGLINETWLTIEPKLFGKGLPLFLGADVDLNLELLETKQLDTNVVQVKYRVK